MECPVCIDEEGKQRAILSLAKDLYFTMERADPSDEYDWDRSLDENWEALRPHRRSFYENSVAALLSRKSVVIAALG